MRKIDTTNYDVKLSEEQDPIKVDVRGNIIQLIYGETQDGTTLLERHTLATKFQNESDTVLLEESDWNTLAELVRTTKVFSRPFVEFVDRVLNAPQVDVTEAG